MRFVLFVVLFLASYWSSGADVERYQILKGRHYYQVAGSAPILQTNNMYRFSANVYATTNGNVLGATLYPPTGAGRNLLADADGDPFRVRERFDTAGELAQFFPNGGYQLGIQTAHEGNKTLNHSIGGDVYPNAPRLANYTAMQNIPYNFYSEIMWDPFVGGTTNDFIQVQIEKLNGDTVFETPDVGQAGALNGLATRALLEPGDLTSGVNYVGTIRFIKVLQSGNVAYPGVPGAVGYFTRTEFTVRSIATEEPVDVDRVELWQTARYLQSTNKGPELQAEGWQFRARVEANSSDILASAEFISPTPSVRSNLVGSAETYNYDEEFATRTEMQSRFRTGNYTINVIRANRITDAWTVPFAAGEFPPAPNLKELPVAGRHDADQDLVVMWDPWLTSDAFDFVRLELSDARGTEIFQSPGFTSNRRLRGPDGMTIIPATVLRPGRDYILDVTFRNVTSMQTGEVPGGLALSGYASRTRFTFSTIPGDVRDFGIFLSRTRWQHGNDVFTTNEAPPFLFEANANASAPNFVLSAELTTPTAALVPLARSTNAINFVFQETNGLDLALANYPPGLYTFRFNTAHDGSPTSTVVLASKEFPPFPKVRTFQALEFVRGGEDSSFTFSWDPWPGARPGKDFVQLIIDQATGPNLLDTGAAWVADAQSGTSTNFGIFEILQLNRSYVGRLRFVTLEEFDSAAYPAALGRSVVYSETRFYISTLDRNTRMTMPRASFLLTPQHELQYLVSPVLTNRFYRVEARIDGSAWMPVQTNFSGMEGNAFRIRVPTSAGSAAWIRTGLLP